MSTISATARTRRGGRARRGLYGRSAAAQRSEQAAPAVAQLACLLHRRWAPAVLAELLRGDTHPGGCKFITLANRLGLGRATLSATLAHLIHHDFLMRNPGIGHPMRPEYLLAERGHDMAPHCRDLLTLLRARRLEDVCLRKWSLPILAALGFGLDRFSQVKAALPGATGRAVSMALRELAEAGLVTRRVTDAFPPRVTYRPGPRAVRLIRLLRRLAG